MGKTTNVLKSLEKSSVSRRSFLKGTAALGAMAAMYGCSKDSGSEIIYGGGNDDSFDLTPPAITEKIVTGSAPHNCGGRCITKAYIAEVGGQNKIKRIVTDERPDDELNPQLRACVRCRSYKTRVHHPGRLTYPLAQGYDESGNRIPGFQRGDMTQFKRISWETAYNIIKNEYEYVKKQWGDEAVYWQYASGAPGTFNARAAMQRFLQASTGGYVNQWGSYSSHQINYIAPIVQGHTYTFTATPQEWLDTDYMLLWGSHFATSINDTNVTNYYLQAREKAGFKSVYIGPEHTMTAELADEWVKIKPFTDGAMMLAMMYVMLDEGLFDPDIEKYAVGLFDCPDGITGADGEAKTNVVSGSELFMKVPAGASLSAYIWGEDAIYEKEVGGKTFRNKAASIYKSKPDSKFQYKRDMGVAKTPEWAEKICGVKADKIREIARDFANRNRNAYLHCSLGMQRQMEGVNVMWQMTALTVMAGQWGTSGTGWGKYFNYTKSVSSGDMKKVLAGATPSNKIPSYITIPCSSWADAVRNGGTGTSDYNDGEVRKLNAPLKMIWTVGGNIINQHMDSFKTSETLKDRDGDKGLYFHVVLEQFMTPTSRYADVILPVTMNWERIELHTHENYMVLSNKAVDAPGEAKSEFQIADELCDVFGVSKALVTNNKTEDEFAKGLWESKDDRPFSYEEFKRQGVVVNAASTMDEYKLNACKLIKDNKGVQSGQAFTGSGSNSSAVQFNTRTGYVELYSAQGRMEYEYRREIKVAGGANRVNFATLFPGKSEIPHPKSTDDFSTYTHLNIDSEGDPEVYEIPVYFYPMDGYVDYSSEMDMENISSYNFTCLSTHSMFRSHSTHNNTPLLREISKYKKDGSFANDSTTYNVSPTQATFSLDGEGLERVWINVDDAASLNIQNGNRVKITSAMTKRAIYASAFVTKRVMSGVVIVSQGSWFDPITDERGEVDQGGCVNSLYNEVPSRMDHGNAQMTAVVKIELA